MCFSAEASFTVGSVLTVIGISTLKVAPKKSLRVVAMVPLLFAVQQFAEGIVWLNINGELHQTPACEAAQLVYLLFAWAIWPAFAPFSLIFPEKIPWRKNVIILCFLLGAMISLKSLYFLATEEVTATIVENNLHYGGTSLYDNVIYGIATLTAPFVSSIKNMRVFGLWLLIFFIASQVIFATTFTSVWCFFAAALSILLYKILKDCETV